MAASITIGSNWPAAAIASTSRVGQDSSDDEPGEWHTRWLLRHNKSISPGRFMAVVAVLSVISLGIAMGFWAIGATLVLPFVGAELLALAAAFLVHARHAADCEDIRLGPQGLTVIHRDCGRIMRVDLHPHWVRVEHRRDGRSLIELSSKGRRAVVGRFVRPERRRQLAQEIREALQRWQPGVA